MTDKINIEIYDRATGEVVSTRTINDTERGMRQFMFYWNMQCDTETYSYRFIKKAGEL